MGRVPRSIANRRTLSLCSLGLLTIASLLAACASGPRVTRTDVHAEVDLSGYWNDTDSRKVSEEMIDDSL
ncbi:MAG: hypothetical protein CL908_02310, partial [Deltaproteobacteria bacterium]|nr:hypothetical protein [Deltaproteobacteria bacterium]